MSHEPTLPAVDGPAEIPSTAARQDGDRAHFESLMRQHNQKLFRVARGILKDDSEAEDAVQDAYVTAYKALPQFRGESQLSTWLTRIVINEALGRLRRQKRERVVIPFAAESREEPEEHAVNFDEGITSPEGATLRAEMRALLERKIDDLPVAFRMVFIMREVQEMTVEETAECLHIPAATVRTRLFRARSLLRESIAHEIDVTTPGVFAFAGDRCDRIVAAVLSRIA